MFAELLLTRISSSLSLGGMIGSGFYSINSRIIDKIWSDKCTRQRDRTHDGGDIPVIVGLWMLLVVVVMVELTHFHLHSLLR